MADVFLPAGVRTPFVTAGGVYARRSALELSIPVVQRMRAQTRPDLLVWGQVIPDPTVSNIARELVFEAGLEPTIPAYSTVLACSTSFMATLQPNGSGGVNIFYVHTDHLNAPGKVAQPTTGTLAWRWDADPFGTAAANQNPAGLGTFVYNLRFPGQYYQAETALNQNWNRDYDSLVGRYVESDPIGLKGGVGTYTYVGGHPVGSDDPRGLAPLPDDVDDPTPPPGYKPPLELPPGNFVPPTNGNIVPGYTDQDWKCPSAVRSGTG